MQEQEPVIIVDPLSSGVELAPAFRRRGVPAIALTLQNQEWPEFGGKICSSDFVKILANQPEILSLVRACRPRAIIPGTEEGIPLADSLTQSLLPHLANDPMKARHRAHKAGMQEALAAAGVASLATIDSKDERQVAAWIADQGMSQQALVLKPPMSSGSEMVFHIDAGAEWRPAFRHILAEPSVLTAKPSESVVVQEQAIGVEYAVGTVSAAGKHYLSHLMRYHKNSVAQRKTVFDYVEFMDCESAERLSLYQYTCSVLDALGVRWGAAHTEVMLTASGPRLIESSPRMIGGPVMEFSRAATGSCQADKLVEIYVDGEVCVPHMKLKQTVVPVFLRNASAGILKNLEIFDGAAALPTFLCKHLWFQNGAFAPQTIDYLTSIGLIALAGDRRQIMRDYEKIRALEAQLQAT